MRRVRKIAWGALAWTVATLASATPADAQSIAERRAARAERRAVWEAFWTDLEARVALNGGSMASEAELLTGVATYACMACHGGLTEAQRALLDERRPPLLTGAAAVGARVNRAWLEAFLADPRGTRAHTTHPHQLGGLAESERAAVAADLAAFLTAGAVPKTAPSTSSASELEHGRRLFHTVGCVACHVPEESAEDLAWTLADWNRFDAADATDAIDATGTDSTDAESLDEDVSTTAGFVPPGTLPPGSQPIPSDLAAKYSRETLAAFLADPLAVRPSGHMPDLALGADGARAVAAYLLRAAVQGDGERFVEAPGLLLTAEKLSQSKGAAKPGDLPPASESVQRVVTHIDLAHRIADDQFALRYEGILSVPMDGDYTFRLRSDDGSWLDLDGMRTIDNGGDHAPATKETKLQLVAGAHTFALVMYEHAGGEELSLEWEGPGVKKGPVPASAFSHWAVEFPGLGLPTAAGDAKRGEVAFVSYGCLQCHTDVEFGMVERAAVPKPRACVAVGPEEVEAGARLHLALDLVSVWMKDPSLGWARVRGSDTTSEDGRLDPSFSRLAERVADLEASPADRAQHLMEQRACLNCHRRGDVGGVHPERKAYFLGDERAELGDEGRYPPHLTGVGRKLNDGALERALGADTRVRPFTSTRMPKFGLANVGSLVADFVATDRDATPGLAEPDAPIALPPNAVQLGRRLAGVQDGLGCVQCHDFLGTPSLGVRAVDLGQLHARVRWPWFRDLLLDPTSVNMNTRMTAVFVDGHSPVADIYDGDPERQVAALWAFLAEGDSMAPPPGIRTGEAAYELEPFDEVRMVGVFMRDVSPRVLCVGTPEGVHFAWDMQRARLAKVWRGRFLNVRGTWEGRAGALESPPTKDVLELPPGPSLALHAGRTGAWPASDSPRQRRRIPEEDDTLFEWPTPLVIEHELAEGSGEDAWIGTVSEAFRPEPPGEGGAAAVGRHVAFVTLGTLPPDIAIRLAVGRKITPAGERAWRVTGATDHTIVVDHLSTLAVYGIAPRFVVVKGEGGQELRAVVDLTAEGRALRGALFDVSWRIEW